MSNGTWFGCEERIAWLLRTNRIYGVDERMAVGTVFAKAFRGRGSHRTIDGSQLTRWEKADQRVDHRVLRRYEQLLQLPENRLVAVIDTLYRLTFGQPGPSRLVRDLDGDSHEIHHRTELLIDKALSSEVMSGNDWDELTVNLSAMRGVFLYPSKLWNDLIGRLVAEVLIADGLGWLQRSEALHRMLGHPIGEPIVIAACAALADDPNNQVFIDLLTCFESSPHPDAGKRLLGQIVNPTNDHALRGAWWSVAEKMGRGHFLPGDLDLLSRYAVELLQAGDQHPACRLAAAELLRQNKTLAPSLARAIQRITGSDRLSRQVLRSGRIAPVEVSTAVVARLTLRSTGLLPHEVRDPDPMLRQLLDEMLFHPRISKRFVASQLVGATPYRTPVAHALAHELTSRSVFEDSALAPAIISAVSRLGDGRSFQLLQRLALTSGAPRFVTESALWSLGHARGISDDAFWLTAIDRHRGHLTSLRGIVYGLGITRNMELLRRCRIDSSLPLTARRAAAWWLNLPSHVLDSTVKALF